MTLYRRVQVAALQAHAVELRHRQVHMFLCWLLPGIEDWRVIVSETLIVEYSVSKLILVSEKRVQMMVQEHLQVSVMCLPHYQPETSRYVSSFIWPGAEVPVVHPVILKNTYHRGIHCSLNKIHIQF